MSLDLSSIVEIIEIEYVPTVNKYLKEGWVLIDKVGNRYILGWKHDDQNPPKHLDEPLTEVEFARIKYKHYDE